MKRTPLQRHIPLKAKTPLKVRVGLKSHTTMKRGKKIKVISERKVNEINQQETVRIALCIRAGGSASVSIRKTVGGNLVSVKCEGGRCEICHKSAEIVGQLETHAHVSRSVGGRISMEVSRMVCRSCHEADQRLPIAERLLDAYDREILEPNQTVEDSGEIM